MLVAERHRSEARDVYGDAADLGRLLLGLAQLLEGGSDDGGGTDGSSGKRGDAPAGVMPELADGSEAVDDRDPGLLCQLDLGSHALGRLIEPEGPQLVTEEHQLAAEAQGELTLGRDGVVHELREVDVRGDGDAALHRGRPAVLLGPLDVVGVVPAARGADVNLFHVVILLFLAPAFAGEGDSPAHFHEPVDGGPRRGVVPCVPRGHAGDQGVGVVVGGHDRRQVRLIAAVDYVVDRGDRPLRRGLLADVVNDQQRHGLVDLQNAAFVDVAPGECALDALEQVDHGHADDRPALCDKVVGDRGREVRLARPGRPCEEKAIPARLRLSALRQQALKTVGVTSGDEGGPLVVVRDLEGVEGAPQEAVAHPGLADDLLDPIPEAFVLLGLALGFFPGSLLSLLSLMGGDGLVAGAAPWAAGDPHDAAAELHALVVAQGPAKLAGHGLGGVGQPGVGFVAAQDPAEGVLGVVRLILRGRGRRRLPA